ncbi:MAG: hypothetical protein ACLPUG_05065 [Acidimicrobiales bacterium]|jgi:alkanesulfonate monooxygenase SsuD/methylene tetrahydromethanopterin reductase-like flavin-dependent oxidoreductase (luciferase family)
MRAKVLAAAESAGRQPDEITCALNVEIALEQYDDPREEVISGPVDKVAERLGALVAVGGFSAFNFVPTGARLAEQAEVLAAEVVPRVRSMT